MVASDKGGRVTIRTVAADAGVSVAAVSKVLREAYGVSDALRAKVQASMAKLNYRPHAAARGMRGQSYTLGVTFSDLHNPFFSQIMTGIDQRLQGTQYHPLLGVSQISSRVEHELVSAMIDRQMDGLILVGPQLSDPEVAGVARQIPTVVIGHHAPGAEWFDTVNNDDDLGGELIVDHLVAAGRRRIAYLSLSTVIARDSTVSYRRELGYRRAMARHGLEAFAQVIRAGQTSSEIQAAARQLLEKRNRAEAIFCWTDFVGFEVMSLARELGLQMPEDLAVVGYDNTAACALVQNAMTSVDQSGIVLGFEAARLLISRIEGRQTSEHLVVTPRLVPRASSGN